MSFPFFPISFFLELNFWIHVNDLNNPVYYIDKLLVTLSFSHKQ